MSVLSVYIHQIQHSSTAKKVRDTGCHSACKEIGGWRWYRNVEQMYHTTSGDLGHETNNSLDGSCIPTSERKE